MHTHVNTVIIKIKKNILYIFSLLESSSQKNTTLHLHYTPDTTPLVSLCKSVILSLSLSNSLSLSLSLSKMMSIFQIKF